MEEKFHDILDKDEKIISVFKPVKRRYWRAGLAPFAIPLFWPHLIILLVITFFTLPFFYAKAYYNIYYAYTNKRLIVRKGIFGNNFASLEYKDITATSVKVGFLDKGCETGTLEFSSPSVHAGVPLRFNYISNPYENMKLIKEQIDSAIKK